VEGLTRDNVTVILTADANPWSVLYDSTLVTAAYMTVFSLASFVCFILASVKLFFHARAGLGKKCQVSVSHVVLGLEVIASLLFTVYNAVDPVFLRGILTRGHAIGLFSVSLLTEIIAVICFQFYWLEVARSFTGSAFFLRSRTLKIWFYCALTFIVGSQIWFSVYCVSYPQPNLFMLKSISVVVACYGIVGFSVIILSCVNAINMFLRMRSSKSIPQRRARKVTTRMIISVVSIGGVLISAALLVSNWGASQDVWIFFLCGVVMGQSCIIMSSLAKILSFKNSPRSPATELKLVGNRSQGVV